MQNTMKCPHCGASISLTDERCPSCGRINWTGQSYNADKKRYEKQTDAVVRETNPQKLYSVKVLVRGIAILLLLAVMVVLITYSITHDAYKVQQKYAARHYASVAAQLDEYWDSEDYYSFFNYADSLCITGWTGGPFADYQDQINAAQMYIFINNYLAEYLSADNIYDRNRALSGMRALLAELDEYDSSRTAKLRANMDNVLKTYLEADNEQE